MCFNFKLCSVQFRVVFVRSDTPIILCVPPLCISDVLCLCISDVLCLCISDVSPVLPLSGLVWLTRARYSLSTLSSFRGESVECFPFPRLAPPGDRWCDVDSFVPAGSVLFRRKLEVIIFHVEAPNTEKAREATGKCSSLSLIWQAYKEFWG